MSLIITGSVRGRYSAFVELAEAAIERNESVLCLGNFEDVEDWRKLTGRFAPEDVRVLPKGRGAPWHSTAHALTGYGPISHGGVSLYYLQGAPRGASGDQWAGRLNTTQLLRAVDDYAARKPSLVATCAAPPKVASAGERARARKGKDKREGRPAAGLSKPPARAKPLARGAQPPKGKAPAPRPLAARRQGSGGRMGETLSAMAKEHMPHWWMFGDRRGGRISFKKGGCCFEGLEMPHALRAQPAPAEDGKRKGGLRAELSVKELTASERLASKVDGK